MMLMPPIQKNNPMGLFSNIANIIQSIVRFCLFASILLCMSFFGFANEKNIAPQQIKIAVSNGAYFHKLLELVLEKTRKEYGSVELIVIKPGIAGNRIMRSVETGELSVMWRPYQEVDNYAVRPIPIRILKNLSDYRILLIRQNDQNRFDRVHTLTELSRLKAGMGSHWYDTEVMETNHLPTVTSVSYANLFKMLKAGRFDYFPRGVYQALPEAKAYESHGIVIERKLLLHYENPFCFYVAEKNTALAERIEKGLKMSVADGSFDQRFYQYEEFSWAEKLLQDQDRLVIELKNDESVGRRRNVK